MPIYEYRCKNCEKCFEALVWTSRQEEVACPCCDGSDVERLMSTFATGCASEGGSKNKSTCAPPSGGFS